MTTPTVSVLLDDGTGTFPYDVSGWVRLRDGVTVSSFGRTDEFSTASGAQLALTFDNLEGYLSAGGGFGVLPFGLGDFGTGANAIHPGQRIRFAITCGATTVNRLTGRVTGVLLGWPTGGQEFATLQVSASDVLADLSRRKLKSMVEEEILLASPSSYYTLAEPEGSTAAGDTSGNGTAPLTVMGSGTAPTFGTGTGPGTDGLTATQFFGGKFLGRPDTGATEPMPSTFGLGAVFATSTTPGTFGAYIAWDPPCVLSIDSLGRIRGAGPGVALVGPVVTDGRTHVAAVECHDGITATLWVDGVAVDSGTISATGVLTSDAVYVGGFPELTVAFTGTISHVAAWAGGLPTGSPAAINNAATGATETPTARLARFAAYAGVTTTTTAGMSSATVAPQATSGQSALDAMQAVATVEGGVLYANGDGDVVLQGRYFRSLKTTADLTLDNDDLAPDATLSEDTQQLINYATVTSATGATQTYAGAGWSRDNDYPTSLDIPTTNDADALGAAQWLANKHSTPGIRLPSATFNLLTSGHAEQILARGVGDRLSISPLPSQAWAGAGDVTLEGWSETVTHESWDLTANLLPYALFDAANWDDAGSLWDSAVWAY